MSLTRLKNGNLIEQFGQISCIKLNPKRIHDIVQCLRQLARLKIEVHWVNNQTAYHITERLNFDKVMESVQNSLKLQTNLKETKMFEIS